MRETFELETFPRNPIVFVFEKKMGKAFRLTCANSDFMLLDVMSDGWFRHLIIYTHTGATAMTNQVKWFLTRKLRNIDVQNRKVAVRTQYQTIKKLFCCDLRACQSILPSWRVEYIAKWKNSSMTNFSFHLYTLDDVPACTMRIGARTASDKNRRK